MINGKLHLAIVIGSLCLLSGMNCYGEERNLRALMHWEGEGTIHTVGKNQILFQGVLDGVLYVETEKGALDGAFVTCPVSQKVDATTNKAVTSGSCEITVSPDDVVYAEFDCKGVIGDCKGELRLTEGYGRFEGVRGGSDIRIRSVVGALMKGMASGSIVRAGRGIAILPNLKVITQ